MKTGKEVKIKHLNNYSVVLGSVNNKHPKAVYLSISAWAELKSDEEVNYTKVIRNLNKQLKQSLYNTFNSSIELNYLKDKTIVDLDIRESGIKFGKRSFINCEVTLYLKDEIQVNSEDIKPIVSLVLDTVILQTFEKDKTFNFHKRKR